MQSRSNMGKCPPVMNISQYLSLWLSDVRIWFSSQDLFGVDSMILRISSAHIIGKPINLFLDG